MVYMKKEQLESDQMSHVWDFYDFLIAGKPSNVATFLPNIAMLLLNFQQRCDVGAQCHYVIL